MTTIPNILLLTEEAKAALVTATKRSRDRGSDVTTDRDLLIVLFRDHSLSNIPSVVDIISDGRRERITNELDNSRYENEATIDIVVDNCLQRATITSNPRPVGPIDLLFSVLSSKSSVSENLKHFGLTPHRVARLMRGQRASTFEFVEDLTAQAAAGELDPLIGCDDTIQRMIVTLMRKEKANPVLIGEPGVGKTSIVEGLAQRIASENVPVRLRDYIIYSLSVGRIISGTGQRGLLEERLYKIIDSISHQRAILFIDEIHQIMAPFGFGTEIRDMLKPFLSSGQIKCIGATTAHEFVRHIASDPALERRFHPIYVKEPTKEHAVEILNGSLELYEEVHGVKLNSKYIPVIVDLAKKYSKDRYLPDSAFDIMDEAMAARGLSTSKEQDASILLDQHARISKNQKESVLMSIASKKLREMATVKDVSKPDIISSASMVCGVDIPDDYDKDMIARLSEYEGDINKMVVGQEKAISSVLTALKANLIGLRDSNRPIGAFMFLGPTGSGKTHLGRAIANAMFGSERKLLQFNMAEYSEAHTTSRLVGAPPGYVGHDEGGQLTDKVRAQKEVVIMFDEMEKAHPNVIKLLLGILEEGTLTDGRGRKVFFNNTIIIATGNIGTDEYAEQSKKLLGFSILNKGDEDKVRKQKTVEATLEELKDYYNLEFINRWDDIVVFDALTKEELMKTIPIMIDRGFGNRVESTESGRSAIVELAYKDKDNSPDLYGARPIRRLIEKLVADKGFDILAKDRNATLVIDAENDEIVVRAKE